MTAFDDIVALVARGFWDEAIDRVGKLPDNFDKVSALIYIATELYAKTGEMAHVFGLLEDAKYYAGKIKEPESRAIVYAHLGFAYSTFGRMEESERLFSEAFEYLDRLPQSPEKAEIIAYVAHYLGMAGFFEDAIELFENAFDLVVNSRIEYVQKLDLLIKIGDILVETGDALSSQEALPFYERAFDIFDKLRVVDKGADVRKKIDLCKTLLYSGTPALRKAMKEGRYTYTVRVVEDSNMPDKDKAIALLEVALWLKKMELPTYIDVATSAVGYIDLEELTGEEIEHVAELLTSVGKLREALQLAVKVEDDTKRSELLKGIAVELAGEGDFAGAEHIISQIPDPLVKEEALREYREIVMSR
ncbi:tetratricopeptide repeat protein [Palaeococcus ferrophilus]|uniref:tetratricopeptide repeat protein n=1 Tax=Palaeococcus ferrophilus TaxID=83868 RepID=UPI00064F550C|nr:tetratricopeptide repeat protein [Palaeococcus ferrophilus]